jgi:DNA-binding Xre family transcriptional regulator
LGYINSKEVIFSSTYGYYFIQKEVIPVTIGEAVRQRILQLCQERNISVNKLSSISGVTQSTVNNIVSGRNNSATVSTIKKLCDGLGITIEEFFGSELFAGLEQEIK